MSSQLLNQEEANQFILECHFDLDTIKGKLEEKPELIKSYNPENSETALGERFDGKSPLQLAQEIGFSEIAALLTS